MDFELVFAVLQCFCNSIVLDHIPLYYRLYFWSYLSIADCIDERVLGFLVFLVVGGDCIVSTSMSPI